jgi:hypothetical protein
MFSVTMKGPSISIHRKPGADSFIRSHTTGLPLFEISSGDFSSFTTRPASSSIILNMISTLSVTPLNGLLVFIDHGCLRDGLKYNCGLFGWILSLLM